MRAGWPVSQNLSLYFQAIGRRTDPPQTAGTCPAAGRFGHRRLHVLLRPEGVMLNHKKLYRLCGEERLVARAGVSERIGTSAPMALPQGPDQRLSFDFVSGVACGRMFWVLAVFDDFTRECLALMVDLSLSGIPRCSRARPHRRKARPALPGGQRQRH